MRSFAGYRDWFYKTTMESYEKGIQHLATEGEDGDCAIGLKNPG
jgi:hypothetical protein